MDLTRLKRAKMNYNSNCISPKKYKTPPLCSNQGGAVFGERLFWRGNDSQAHDVYALDYFRCARSVRARLCEGGA
jgi:hypothetical protein